MALSLLLSALFGCPQVVIDPPVPRLGDPVVVYATNWAHGDRPGAVQVFGYHYSLMPVGPETMRAVVALPTDTSTGAHPLRVIHPLAPAGCPTVELQIADRSFETSELTVARKFTRKKRSEALAARLKREQAEIQQVWSSTPTPALDLGRPQRPTKTRLTGYFGTARVFNKARRSVHYGVDLNGRVGTPVYATAAGQVVLSSMRWGSGGTLVLDHGGGLFTVYFHLSRRRVRVGQQVAKGARIGDVGKSGRVTGPHLHFGVAIRAEYADGDNAGQARSMYVDPEAFWALSLRTAPPDSVEN